MRTTVTAVGILTVNALALCVLAFLLATGQLILALALGVAILFVFAR